MSEKPKLPEGWNEKDVIDMPVTRVLCPLHGEVFRSQWPKGFLVFALEGLHTLLADPEIATRCGGEAKKVIEVLDKRPVCCALTKDDLLLLYKKSEIGSEGRCVNCKTMNVLGAPFTCHDGGGRKYKGHMCFWCLVHKLSR